MTVWGTSWDIRWHLLIGRDSFWIPPHLMTYSGVTLIVLVSFGVLSWTISQALRGVAPPGMFRHLGITGTRGWGGEEGPDAETRIIATPKGEG